MDKNIDKIKQWWQKSLDYIKFLKKHAFGDATMKKRTFSVLEKLGINLLISILAIGATVFFGLDSYKKMTETQANMTKLTTAIYGNTDGKSGLKEELKIKKDYLEEEQTRFENNKQNLLKKLDMALPKDFNYYDMVAFLEDYTITMNTKDKPIELPSVSPGSMETVSVPADKLKANLVATTNEEILEEEATDNKDNKNDKENKTKKEIENLNKISIPAEFRVVPLNIVLDAEESKFEDFLRFVYHSGDIENYYYKGEPVKAMAAVSLNLPMKKVEKIGTVNANKPEEVAKESYSIKLDLYLQNEAKTK